MEHEIVGEQRPLKIVLVKRDKAAALIIPGDPSTEEEVAQAERVYKVTPMKMVFRLSEGALIMRMGQDGDTLFIYDQAVWVPIEIVDDRAGSGEVQ